MHQCDGTVIVELSGGYPLETEANGKKKNAIIDLGSLVAVEMTGFQKSKHQE